MPYLRVSKGEYANWLVQHCGWFHTDQGAAIYVPPSRMWRELHTPRGAHAGAAPPNKEADGAAVLYDTAPPGYQLPLTGTIRMV